VRGVENDLGRRRAHRSWGAGIGRLQKNVTTHRIVNAPGSRHNYALAQDPQFFPPPANMGLWRTSEGSSVPWMG
jgi:hypothetical protein